jgi:hypothetical protein
LLKEKRHGIMLHLIAFQATVPTEVAISQRDYFLSMSPRGNTVFLKTTLKIWAGFALIYPIALLIVLSTRTSKEYFERIRFGTAG